VTVVGYYQLCLKGIVIEEETLELDRKDGWRRWMC